MGTALSKQYTLLPVVCLLLTVIEKGTVGNSNGKNFGRCSKL